jgi:hypothetical protein
MLLHTIRPLLVTRNTRLDEVWRRHPRRSYCIDDRRLYVLMRQWNFMYIQMAQRDGLIHHDDLFERRSMMLCLLLALENPFCVAPVPSLPIVRTTVSCVIMLIITERHTIL